MHAHLILLLIAWVWSAAAGATTSTTSSSRSKLTKPGTTIHTAFPTECGLYFVWQSIGMVYSHKKIRQPGPLTRIVSCTPEEWEAMSPESRDFVQTHVAPNYAIHPRTGDKYPAYNKPMAVIDWLAKTNVKEDYVLIIDADMIMRRPILPDPSSPLATSAFFGYMIGVDNELAMKHVPEVTPRDDELAGPKGRRGDKAGGFTMMQTDQLRKVRNKLPAMRGVCGRASGPSEIRLHVDASRVWLGVVLGAFSLSLSPSLPLSLSRSLPLSLSPSLPLT